MCIHHLLLHSTCGHYTVNRPLSCVSHCYFVDFALHFYYDQIFHEPLHLEKPISMPRVCPMHWPDSPKPRPKIGDYHDPPHEFKGSFPTPPLPPLREQGGRGRSRVICHPPERCLTRPRRLSPPCEGGREPGHLACYDRVSRGLAGNVVVHEVSFPCRNQGCESDVGPAPAGPSTATEAEIQDLVDAAPRFGEGEQLGELDASTTMASPSTEQASTIEFFPAHTTHSTSVSPIIPEAMLASTCSAPATYRPETRKSDLTAFSRSPTATWTDNLLWPSFSTSYNSEDARAQQELEEGGEERQVAIQTSQTQQVGGKRKPRTRAVRRNRRRGRRTWNQVAANEPKRDTSSNKAVEQTDDAVPDAADTLAPAYHRRRLNPEAAPFKMPTAAVAATPPTPPPTPPPIPRMVRPGMAILSSDYPPPIITTTSFLQPHLTNPVHHHQTFQPPPHEYSRLPHRR